MIYKSVITIDSIKRLRDIKNWIENRRHKESINIDKIPLDKLEKWSFNSASGILSHASGKFFSIQGIRINTNWGGIHTWEQPIINQPEIGILGIIAKEFDGIMHFLLQAKIEPGNINYVQLSPTLQATKSNYTKVHKGKAPDFLDCFLDKNRNTIIDQLQSEQGARFLQKRNRNMIIKVEENIKHNDNYCWMTLGQIKQLMRNNNIVNMDTRSVIASLDISYNNHASLNMYEKQNGELFSFNELLSWIAEQKTKYELDVRKIPLNEVQNWEITDTEIHHKDGNHLNNNPENLKGHTRASHNVVTHLGKKHKMKGIPAWNKGILGFKLGVDEVRKLYEAGMSTQDIAEFLKTDVGGVVHFMHNHGIKTRTLSEAQTLRRQKEKNAKVLRVELLKQKEKECDGLEAPLLIYKALRLEIENLQSS